MRLPADPGPAGWARLLPDVAPSPELEQKITADWLIIGAGFAGLAAAFRLSQLCPGARIVILEATRVGQGPAGRNSGFMIDLPHDLTSSDYGGALEADRAQIADNRRAIAFAGEMAKTFALPREAYIPMGKINGAASRKGHQHNLDYAGHLAALGEPYEMLDAAQMRAQTGITYYQSGLYTPGTVMLQPAMFVQSVAAGLVARGVHLYENTPVLETNRNGGWQALTPKGQVSAPRAILAVNGHLNSFGYMQGRLIHTHTYASMSRALSAKEIARLGGQPNWNLTPADPLGTTVRRVSGTGGDRIVIRNRFTYDERLKPGPNWHQQVIRAHDRAFAARFPMLKGIEMAYRWGGRLCLSRNNVQVVGELEPGLYSACVQNGLGTAKGTLAGMLAAELACGETSPALRRALAADTPTKLPPAPLTRIAATLRLRFGEWKAGTEK
jgi:glycine/D-amino acid oxidase-like deaminating enzyme